MKRKKGELAWAVVRDAEIEAVEVEKAAEDQGKKVVCIKFYLVVEASYCDFLGAHLPEEN